MRYVILFSLFLIFLISKTGLALTHTETSIPQAFSQEPPTSTSTSTSTEKNQQPHNKSKRNKLKNSTHDEKYWTPLPENTLTTKIGFYAPGSDFGIKHKNGLGLTFIPGVSNGLYYEISKGLFGISYHKANPPTEIEKTQRGESDFKDFQLRFFGHHYSVELIYQNVSGFVLQDWDQTAEGARRPDITTKTYQINLIQSLNPNTFSNAVSYNLDGYQNKSGSSWITMLSLGQFDLSANKPLAPTSLIDDFGSSGSMNQTQALYALAGIGYGGIFNLWHGSFVSLSGILGLGFAQVKYSGSDIYKTDTPSTFRMGLRPAIGYNRGHWLFSFSILVDGTNWKIAETDFQQSSYAVKTIIGYRFF